MPSRFRANEWGLTEALVGLAVGFVLASVLASAVGAAMGHGGKASSYGNDVGSLIGLWIGLVGGAVFASRRSRAARGSARSDAARAAGGGTRTGWLHDLAEDYGFAIRPLVDVPLGAAVGALSQYLLVPLFELPLLPFVPHLFERLGEPATSLTGTANGTAALVVLGVLTCLGSPVVEELYFRGLVLRAAAARLAPLGARLAPVASVVLVGLVFGLVHFEPLQLLALAGFGMVLCVLAWRTGRLGAGIVAHMTFNTIAFVSVARSH